MNDYPTYTDALEYAAEAAQDVYADSDDTFSAVAAERADREYKRIMDAWSAGTLLIH